MDERLVRRVQAGDQEAFRALVVASHARLTRVAQGVLRDPHGAEDAVQQAFLDIWRDIRRLRDPGRFEGWSYKLLLRVCCAEVRRRPRWVPDSQIPAAAEPRAGDVFGVVVANTSHNDGEMMGAEVFSNLDDVRLDDELSARVRTPTLFLWARTMASGVWIAVVVSPHACRTPSSRRCRQPAICPGWTIQRPRRGR